MMGDKLFYGKDGHYDAVRTLHYRVRRAVRIAVQAGVTVPFSLETLIEAGVGVGTIRKVYRREAKQT